MLHPCAGSVTTRRRDVFDDATYQISTMTSDRETKFVRDYDVARQRGFMGLY